MSKIPCSVAMLTYNSEKTLRRALESVKDFDDIILCDGDSTDATHTIAAEYGARVIRQDMRYRYENGKLADGGGARNQMMEVAKHDWYLWLDSDESISKELLDEVERIVRQKLLPTSPLAYKVPIRICIDGQPILHSSNYPGYQFRFFNRKSGGRLTRRAHNRIEFDPTTVIGTVRNPWYVFVESKDIKVLGGNWKHYRRVEIEEAAKRTLSDFMRYIVWFHMRASAGMALKASYNYIRYGFKDSMPIRAELARILSPLVLVVNATLYKAGMLGRPLDS